VLPARTDSFLGRGLDAARLGEELARARIVSIVGPPGIGKTRLALEYARAHGDAYERVLLVALMTSTTLEAALTALAGALHLELPALPEAELVDEVARTLGEVPRTLVVLDNFEQLAPLAPTLLPKLLEAAPAVHLLITTRQRLRVSGEHVHELRGLACDGAEADGAKLLVDRVAKLRGSAPTAGETEQLRSIAERLEGVPLALELAAVKVASLGAANVLERLAGAHGILGVEGTASTQASMRLAVGRSWELLGAAERSLLSACSIFRGGFELDAVTELVGDDVFDALHELSEKSLLFGSTDDGGTTRFFLWENIREFAAEHLPPERYAALVLRHAAYYIAFGSELARAVEGPNGTAALDALEQERDNLLAIEARTLRGELPPEAALRALVALAPLALARGPIAPLAQRLDAALAAVEPRDGVEPAAKPHRLAAALAAARAHRRLGDLPAAKRAQELALGIAGSLGDARIEARLRSDLGMSLVAEGAMEEAQALLSPSARRVAPELDRAGAALDDLRLSMALRELGDVTEAERAAHRALDVFEAEGNAVLAGLAYAELAHVAIELADHRGAKAFVERGLEAVPAAVALLTESALTGRMGMIAHAEGDLVQAETMMSAAMMGLRRIGYRRFEAGVTGYLGAVDLEAGRIERAHARTTRVVDMLRNDPRGRSPFAALLALIEVARGNLAGARRAAAFVGPLRPSDPFSVAAHVFLVPLERVSRASAESLAARLALADATPAGRSAPLRATSYGVRLALRLVELVRGDRAPSIPDVEASPTTPSIEVSSSGAWFRLPGEPRIDCRRYRTLRLLLVKLAQERLVHPNRPASWSILVAAGWPGERILPAAARNRLKVAMASLRKLGLRDVLVHDGEGYFLRADAPLLVLGD
jgi:predicted ATPase